MGLVHVDEKPTLEELLRVASFLSDLTPLEKNVIKMLFGLSVDRTYTLKETRKRLALTEYRIRKIERGALCKLRSSLNVPSA